MPSQQPSLQVAWSHGAPESEEVPPELLLLELPLELLPPPDPPPSRPPSKPPRPPRPPPEELEEPPDDDAVAALPQPPPWHVWPLAVQSVHSSAPLPHSVSSDPPWQLPVESQQPLHDAQEPCDPPLLPESSLAAGPPLDEPLEPPDEDAYELLLAGGAAASASAARQPN